MSFSDYLEKKLNDHWLGAAAYTAPSNVYVALLSDQNTPAQRDAGTVTEITNVGRVTVANNATNWPAASGADATKQNATVIVFPAYTDPTSTNAYAVALFDASSNGNLLATFDYTATAQPFTADASTDTFTCSAHGYSDGTYVKITGIFGLGTLPTGVTDGAYYYIINSATDTFKVSLTNGGSAVNLTANGAGQVAASQHVTINLGTVVTLAVGNLTMRGD